MKKTMLEIRKKLARKKTNRTVDFSERPLTNILNYPAFLFQLVCMKDQAQSSSEILQYSQGKGAFDKSTFIVTFRTILGVTEMLCS